MRWPPPGALSLLAGCLPAWPAQELAARLAAYYSQAEAHDGPSSSSASSPPFAVTFDEPLPLEDFFELVEAHFSARQEVAALRAKLEGRAGQLRSIEKRLLMRFKVRGGGARQGEGGVCVGIE